MKPRKDVAAANRYVLLSLTYMMFMVFAMTTEAVGLVLPQIIAEFKISMTQASSFHYATMGGVALAGLGLGFMTDRFGRKWTIVLGLSAFALSSFLYVTGNRFELFVVFSFMSGLSIGIFKIGALALISDISRSTASHTRTMNVVEGFFGLGSIVGPLVVGVLVHQGASWKWLYVMVAILCGMLVMMALFVKYPTRQRSEDDAPGFSNTLKVARDPYVLAFSGLIMLYVGVETAIAVWLPTYLASYDGSFTQYVPYAIPVFFVLRAAGRFLGSLLLALMSWTKVLVLCSGVIFLCFAGTVYGGVSYALILLPFSGLFMSVLYPTINSKGISGFKKALHGSVGGVILFFTCVSAGATPLIMGMISDHFGSIHYGFIMAMVMAATLFIALLYNAKADPAAKRLSQLDESEYVTAGA